MMLKLKTLYWNEKNYKIKHNTQKENPYRRQKKGHMLE